MKPKYKTTARNSKATSKPKVVSSKNQPLKIAQKQETLPSTTRLPSKPKYDIKPLVLSQNSAAFNIQQRRKFLRQNPSNRHSVSSKEDFGKTTTDKIKLNKNALTNKYSLTSSNNDLKQSIIKKVIKVDNNNNNNNQDSLTLKSIQQLGEMFRTSNLKRTIIIDNDGNTNLNFNFNKICCKEDKNKTDFNKEVQPTQYTSEKITENNINDKDKESPEIPLFVNSNNTDSERLNTEEKEKKEEIFEEENRMKEYGMIFNLLNNNIEQMKNLFNNNIKKGNNKQNTKTNVVKENPFLVKQKEVYQNIITSKEREEIENVQKMIITSSIEINQENAQQQKQQNIINQPNSFLESCIQDDFYQSLAKVTPINMNSSFDFNSMLNINNNEDVSNLFSGMEQTECDNEEKNNNVYLLRRNSLNPHFLLHSKQKMRNNPFIKFSNSPYNINNEIQNKDDDKKCTLF